MALPAHLDNLKKRDPKFYEQLDSIKENALGAGALDAKTKYLLGLALNACLERKEKVQCAVGQARAAGASEEEILQTLRITYFVKGLSTAELMSEL